MQQVYYLICDKYLKIIYDNEYEDLIANKMVSFKKMKNLKEDAILIITNNKLSFERKGKILYEYNICPNKHDLFAIINNAISQLYDSNDRIYIHSSVVSNGKDGCLILGDFGSGKSSLALECEKIGLEINSADQTFLKFNKDKLFMECGSKSLIFKEQKRTLSDKEIYKKINITFILFCVGVCYNGYVQVDNFSNKRYFIKKMFDRASFHFKFPLITNNEYLPSLYKENIQFISKIAQSEAINKFTVRGDPKSIAEEISKKLRGDIYET